MLNVRLDLLEKRVEVLEGKIAVCLVEKGGPFYPTYSIGESFIREEDGGEYILAGMSISSNGVGLISLEEGALWDTPHEVMDVNTITAEEWKEISNGEFVRA